MYNNSSVEFAERLYEALEAGGSRLSFFIGGAEGLPPSLKSDPRRRRRLMCANCDVSLLEDDLHVTHQMARRFCSWSRCEGPLQAMCFLHLQTRVYPPHLRTCASTGLWAAHTDRTTPYSDYNCTVHRRLGLAAYRLAYLTKTGNCHVRQAQGQGQASDRTVTPLRLPRAQAYR